jgi:hypothetical protein
MKEKGILLIQKGDFSQESILPVLNIIEQNFKKDKSSKKNKSVYHVLVELLQNISNYSLEIDGRHDGIFMIQQSGPTYMVAAGNYIVKEKVADFERRLKTVQTLEDARLEEIYQKELMEEDGPSLGNVGLGLIDIAREGIVPLSYQFHLIDETKMFFTILVTI